jgi:hypothetical protein
MFVLIQEIKKFALFEVCVKKNTVIPDRILDYF